MLKAAIALGVLVLTAHPARAGEAEFNEPGNILTSDQFNNRALEFNRDRHIVWSFGSGDPNLCNPGPGAIIAPNDVERLAQGLTLIVGTGTSTCPDNRVIVVDQAGNIVFQYGQAGVAGSGPNELNVPVFAIETPSHTFLITDQANNRIIEVDKSGNLLYQYGPTAGPGALNNPNSAELLADGHILIADENNNRFLEIDPAKNNRIVYQHRGGLETVAFASRVQGGHTLVTDSGHNRIIELDKANKLIFQYATNREAASNPNPNPSNAVKLKDGSILIADQFNNRDIIIDTSKKIIFQYGKLNVVGNGQNELNAPYNAVVIGDYTGVTTPPPSF